MIRQFKPRGINPSLLFFGGGGRGGSFSSLFPFASEHITTMSSKRTRLPSLPHFFFFWGAGGAGIGEGDFMISVLFCFLFIYLSLFSSWGVTAGKFTSRATGIISIWGILKKIYKGRDDPGIL